MQTPVRFYITQSDDQPVVRTIAVPQRVAEIEPQKIEARVAPIAETPEASHRSVAKLVRSAVKRTGSLK